jgi:RNA polymerase sigma-70 factor (ECF subfamily)
VGYVRDRDPHGELLDSPQSLLSSLARHYDELVDYIRVRFINRGFAHDVVHDVCLRLMERPEPQWVRAPLALLRRISYDAAVDRCRSENVRHRWVEPVANLPDQACPTPDHTQTLSAHQELEHLIEAIQRLPLRRRHVFIMHKIHELPQAEVAARLGISLKMVEKHLRLGMAACRQALDRDESGHAGR